MGKLKAKECLTFLPRQKSTGYSSDVSLSRYARPYQMKNDIAVLNHGNRPYYTCKYQHRESDIFESYCVEQSHFQCILNGIVCACSPEIKKFLKWWSANVKKTFVISMHGRMRSSKDAWCFFCNKGHILVVKTQLHRIMKNQKNQGDWYKIGYDLEKFKKANDSDRYQIIYKCSKN